MENAIQVIDIEIKLLLFQFSNKDRTKQILNMNSSCQNCVLRVKILTAYTPNLRDGPLVNIPTYRIRLVRPIEIKSQNLWKFTQGNIN